MLQELDDPKLVCRFLAQVMPQDGEVQLDKSFPAFCKQHGWPTFEANLTAVIDASSAKTILRNATLLEVLCLERKKDPDRIEICRRLAEHIVATLDKIDRQRPKNDLPDDVLDDDWSDESLDDNWSNDHRRVQPFDRAALLTVLVKSLIAVGAEKPLTRLIDHTLSQRSIYDLTGAHLKAIFALEAWLPRRLKTPSAGISRWLRQCRTELERRTANAPTAPIDFRRTDKLSCQCGDCRQLSQFLADPHQSVRQFPLAKDRRQHLHQMIDACGCDLTHVTARKGRPYTLVCTKTTASYERACQVYSRDCENLKRLQAMEERIFRSAKS